jgi:hypothetical protein
MTPDKLVCGKLENPICIAIDRYSRNASHGNGFREPWFAVHGNRSNALCRIAIGISHRLPAEPDARQTASGLGTTQIRCYPRFVAKTAKQGSPPPSRPVASLSFEELAAQQSVAPIEDFEGLIGGPASEDESLEEFSAILRAWRCEGPGARDPQ